MATPFKKQNRKECLKSPKADNFPAGHAKDYQKKYNSFASRVEGIIAEIAEVFKTKPGEKQNNSSAEFPAGGDGNRPPENKDIPGLTGKNGADK